MSNDHILNPSENKWKLLKTIFLVCIFIFLFILVDQRNLFKKLLQFRDANKKLYFKSQNEKQEKQRKWKKEKTAALSFLFFIFVYGKTLPWKYLYYII